MASNYSHLHLATISDANSEMIYCCKNCERWSKGADWRRSTVEPTDQIICSLTNKHLLFINFVITFQIFINMTFELRPSQRTDYRFFTFWREKSNLIFKHMLKDTFYADRMIWRRKVKERSGISRFFFFLSLSLSFDTMSVYYNANLKVSQVNLS